jgi:hypothetical protein
MFKNLCHIIIYHIMESLAECQQLTNMPFDIFSIFSKRDNVLMSCTAKDDLKTHSSELHDDIPPKKDIIKH